MHGKNHGLSFIFLSTLSLRRATHIYLLVSMVKYISIHALLAESDELILRAWASASSFLSTLSLRRATCRSARHTMPYQHFYPRSPCGERPQGR